MNEVMRLIVIINTFAKIKANLLARNKLFIILSR